MEKTQYAAIYARYSTDSQSKTSIEDQIRQCKAVAQRHGYQVKESHIFSDSAISGKLSALHQREGFKKLLRALDGGEIKAVFIDELTRAGRGFKILADFSELLKRRNIRLVGGDGVIDSHSPMFDILLGILSGMSGHELSQIKERTKRGMEGVLERGGMVGYPPFGYTLDERLDETTGMGAKWSIHEENAKYVQFMYEARASGKSYQWIANEMQNRGVPIPRKGRIPEGGFWRPGTVKQLLKRTIFRGVLTWNGSEYCHYKAKKENRDIKPVEYPRPELRIVDDELWYQVQGKPGKNIRKGFKHPLTHRVSCAVCGNNCTLKHSSVKTKLLYCASCDCRKRAGLLPDLHLEIGVGAAFSVIRASLKEAMKPEVKEAYRAILTEVAGRSTKEDYQETKQKADKIEKRLAGIAKVMAMGLGDTDQLIQDIDTLQVALKAAQATMKELDRDDNNVSPEEINSHIDSLDSSFFIDMLVNGDIPEDEANEILKRIFSYIKLKKISRADSIWTLGINLQELAHNHKDKRIFRNGGRMHLKYQVNMYRPRSGTEYNATLLEKRLSGPSEYQDEIEEAELNRELKEMCG